MLKICTAHSLAEKEAAVVAAWKRAWCQDTLLYYHHHLVDSLFWISISNPQADDSKYTFFAGGGVELSNASNGRGGEYLIMFLWVLICVDLLFVSTRSAASVYQSASVY
jgi:hypothetical protein